MQLLRCCFIRRNCSSTTRFSSDVTFEGLPEPGRLEMDPVSRYFLPASVLYYVITVLITLLQRITTDQLPIFTVLRPYLSTKRKHFIAPYCISTVPFILVVNFDLLPRVKKLGMYTVVIKNLSFDEEEVLTTQNTPNYCGI